MRTPWSAALWHLGLRRPPLAFGLGDEFGKLHIEANRQSFGHIQAWRAFSTFQQTHVRTVNFGQLGERLL